MIRRAVIGFVSVVVVACVVLACTETPDTFPECVGPGAYCPSDDAGADAMPDASTDAGVPLVDAGQDAAIDGSSEDAGNG